MCKVAFSVFCVCLYLIHSVYGQGTCTIQIPAGNPPLFSQKFGSKTILLPLASSPLYLDEGEVIHGYCSSQFSYFNYDGPPHYSRHNEPHYQNIDLTCSNGELMVKSSPYIVSYRRSADLIFACVGRTWSLFETKDKFTNCDNFMSYALGAKTPNNPIILAGLCYDLDNFSLKYVNYVAHRKTAVMDNQQKNYPEQINTGSLAEPVGNFNNLLRFVYETPLEAAFLAKTSTNFWLQFAKYQYNLLVQSKRFGREFKEFRKVFDTIWWDNLRLGNWKQLTDILDERSMSMTYAVYIGTSGAVRVPNQSKSSDTLVLDVGGSQFDRTRQTIPEYIWSYLRLESDDATDSEDFVVIGYNSPYFGYFARNETIFCTDICNRIDWLAPIEKTRMVSTLGVVFCCRPEDVEHRLDGFPQKRHGLSTNDHQSVETTPTIVDEERKDYDEYEPKSSEESENQIY